MGLVWPLVLLPANSFPEQRSTLTYSRCLHGSVGLVTNAAVCLLPPCKACIDHLIIIYPLTARVVGAHNQFPPFSPVRHCPLGLGELQATSSSVCLVFFPLSLCRARWFWPDLMNGRHDRTTAVCVSLWWSGGLCVLDLGTDFLVGSMVFV